MRVTQFFAFGAPSGGAAPEGVEILLPVEGAPSSTTARVMGVSDFDRLYTHRWELEGAFYQRVRAERGARTWLFTTIAANGGPPAWLLLAPRWPVHGPPITAVMPPLEAPALADLHTIREVRILGMADITGRRARPRYEKAAAAMRRLKDPRVIAVSVLPSLPALTNVQKAAVSGIVVSYDARVAREGNAGFLKVPLLCDFSSEAPALTRIYVLLPRHCRGICSFPGAGKSSAAPQRVVNDALAAFGYSESYRRNWAREHAVTSLSSARTANGDEAVRLVAAFKRVEGEISILARPSVIGFAEIAPRVSGWIVLALLGPLTLFLYLIALWGGLHTYLWLIGKPPPATLSRKFGLVAVLGPVLTPWFMLRYVGPSDETGGRSDEGGALGVLSFRTYECLARLVVWGLLICVNWAVIVSVSKLGLWLRFG